MSPAAGSLATRFDHAAVPASVGVAARESAEGQTAGRDHTGGQRRCRRSLALPASRADGLGYLVNAGRPYSWVTTYKPDPTGAHMPAQLQTTAVST